MSSKTLFVSAGDPSGDIAGALLINELKSQFHDLRIFGLGGDQLGQLGQEQFAAPKDLAVLGFWEVAKRYPFFRNLFYRCLEEIKQRKPSCVLLIDYPGFNLRLAAKVKALGIPVIYYIAPQVWAWGKGRTKLLRRDVDRLLTILPFEQEFFTQHGIKSDFVGHYLLEAIPQHMIGSPPGNTKRLAIMPGSRKQEVERMLPVMLEAATRFNHQTGWTGTVAALENGYDYSQALARYGDASIDLRYNEPRQVIHESSLVLAASGTATLEAGIISRPMVIIYRTSALSYQIAKRLVTLPSVGLVNLVLGKQAVPELIQEQASADSIFKQLTQLSTDHASYETQLKELQTVHTLLGERGASSRAARIVAEYLC